MASVYKQGRTVLLQIGAGSSRRVRRLGNLSRDGMGAVEFHVGQIEQARKASVGIPPATQAWLCDITDDLHAKLAALQLVSAREQIENGGIGLTISKLFDDFLSRRNDLRGSTRVNYGQAKKKASEFFSPLKLVAKIGVAEAKDFRRHLESTLSAASVSGFIKRMRCVFADAVERGNLKSNPFTKVVAGSQSNAARLKFVPGDDIEKVIAMESCVQWRCLIALARYGGLRCPSEPSHIRLSEVDWTENEIIVRSDKTKRQGKAVRHVPIFDELLPYLRAAYDAAAADQVHLLPAIRSDCNPHTRLKRLVERAGLRQWPKLFQNLRASRETELIAQGYQLHNVCAWIGNSPDVANRHYLMLTPQEKERAVSAARAAKSAALGTNEIAQFAQVKEKGRDFQVKNAALHAIGMPHVTPTGIEPVSRP